MKIFTGFWEVLRDQSVYCDSDLRINKKFLRKEILSVVVCSVLLWSKSEILQCKKQTQHLYADLRNHLIEFPSSLITKEV